MFNQFNQSDDAKLSQITHDGHNYSDRKHLAPIIALQSLHSRLLKKSTFSVMGNLGNDAGDGNDDVRNLHIE